MRLSLSLSLMAQPQEAAACAIQKRVRGMQSRAQLPSKTGRLAQNQELIGQKLLHLQEAGEDVRRIATGQGDLEGLYPALLSCVVQHADLKFPRWSAAASLCLACD